MIENSKEATNNVFGDLNVLSKVRMEHFKVKMTGTSKLPLTF